MQRGIYEHVCGNIIQPYHVLNTYVERHISAHMWTYTTSITRTQYICREAYISTYVGRYHSHITYSIHKKRGIYQYVCGNITQSYHIRNTYVESHISARLWTYITVLKHTQYICRQAYIGPYEDTYHSHDTYSIHMQTGIYRHVCRHIPQP